jgi:hypothetical protein
VQSVLKSVADVRAFVNGLPEHANDGEIDPEHIAVGSLSADSKTKLLGLLRGATSDLNFVDAVVKRHADSVIHVECVSVTLLSVVLSIRLVLETVVETTALH